MNLGRLPKRTVAWAFRAAKIGLYEMAHLCIRPLWWCLSLVWWCALPRKLPEHRRVLLLANNEMLARFAGDLAKELAKDDRLSICFSRPPFVDRRVSTSATVAEVGMPAIGFLRALVTRWDLIINPDHFPSALFHPAIPKIFSAHGLFTGKRIRGQLYEYGHRAWRWNGRPVYARIFSSGEIERERALAFAPSLSEIVAVTGSLQVDTLLERNRHRAEIRAKLGLSTDRKTLLVMSSWGPKALLQYDGQWLLPRLQALTDEYTIYLAAHRNNFFRGTSGSRDWNLFRTEMADSGIRVPGTRDDWWQYLVAADIAICDFTSLGLYFAQLVRPMVFVSIRESGFDPGSPLLQVYDISPKLAEADTLRNVLANAELHYPRGALRSITERMVGFQGSAASRIRSVVLEVLQFPQNALDDDEEI